MTRPVEADTVVTLSSSDTNVATVPGSVTVLTGQTLASFDITGVAPGAVDITAILGRTRRSSPGAS